MLAPARVPAASLDAVLFDDTQPLVLIDRHNAGDGTVPDLDSAVRAVQHGRAASYAGRLRAGVVAVDVDLDDERLTDYLMDELTGWCARRQIWHLARASGGGPGRRHLFIAAGGRQDELVQLVALLRRERRLTGRQLDLRDTVRPLSAPHRTAGAAGALGDIPAHLIAEFRRHHRPAQRHSQLRRRQKVSEPQPAIVPANVEQAIRHMKRTGDRSHDEFVLTRDLQNSGHDVPIVWSAVRSLGGHSATRGFAWWLRNVWQAVRPLQRDAEPKQVNIGRILLPTFERIRGQLDPMPTAQRYSVEMVGWALLERLTVAAEVGDGATWVPMSQRDLELATGRDRRTIAAALAALVDIGAVERRVSRRRDDAHEWRIGPSAVVASPDAPPLLTPPAPTWAHTAPPGTASAALDHHLGTQRRPGSTRQTALRQTAHQAATTAGLLGAPRTTPACRQEWTARLHRVQAERDEFHPKVRAHRQARHDQWTAERSAALAANRNRHRRWWRSLDPEERDRRRRLHREKFHQLTEHGRAERRAQLRSRRRPAPSSCAPALAPASALLSQKVRNVPSSCPCSSP